MKGELSTPGQTDGRTSAKRASWAAGVAGVVLFVVGVVQDIPGLWLGIVLAGGLTTAAALFGLLTSLAMLTASALILWLLPPLLGRASNPVEVVGMVLLVLPSVLAGHGIDLRIRSTRQRELEQTRRTRLLTEAAMTLQKIDNTDALYRTILRMLADILEFTHATVWARREDRMHLIVSHRWEVPSGFSLPLTSVIGEAAESRQPNYVPDVRKHSTFIPAPDAPETLSEFAIPLMMEERVAAVLNIEHTEEDAFGPDERRTLLALGKMAEEALERASLHMQIVEMLEVIRNLAQSDEPTALFQEAVRSAIRLIPGAEAGSLMIFDKGSFRFVAAEGYDRARLSTVAGVGLDAQVKWYAGSEEDFGNGVPRLLTGAAITAASMAGLDTDEQRSAILDAGRLRDLTANICVPVTYGGTVLGMLNIDSFAASNPFGPHALLLADTFAQQIAVIIRQTLYRDALERAVVSDSLTGLGNREGFNRQLNVELARARRYGQTFNLVMIDLDGFKRINDRLGHHAGDRALKKVGEVMEGQRREGDSIFRWGGDEFALILPQISRQQAWLVAERYSAAIAGVSIDDYSLAASFGIASYPEDGTDAESLLRKADDLMYRQKPA